MNYQHQSLAAGRWQELDFFIQMANIGSEVIRAINWQKKERADYAKLAGERALELLSLTIDDPQNRSRLAELTRLYECLVDYLFGNNIYGSSNKTMTNYFTAFTYAAQLRRLETKI